MVVGAGLAGLRACETLRRDGYEGRLTLVGAEKHLPYDRPPLSKQLLAGTFVPEQCTLLAAGRLGELGLDLELGVSARALELSSRTVELSDGRRLGFDGLVVATGATPRKLEGISGRPGVGSLRTLDDCLALREVLDRPGVRILIAGAGFIGLEVAATAKGLGAEVTVVEPLGLPLARVLPAPMAAVFESVHRDEGVDLRLRTTLDAVETVGVSGLASRCALSDGTELEVDAVLVAIGVVPETGWLEESGLDVGQGGLSCDPSLTAAPGVVAAGDLARWTHPLTGESLRIEHRTNASEQGEHAARSLLAGDARTGFAPVPYVWSDQYAHKVQVLGTPAASDEAVVVEGTLAERRFVAVMAREGRLSGVLGFSRPRALMAYRPLLERGASLEEALSLPTR